MEVIARNQYMAGDNRDPTQCSLFYFALGKVKLVQGLWRQAAWHKEQSVMLKFLNNDFSQPRWRTAALKNAFALLSKRRFGRSSCFSSRHCCNLACYRIRGCILPPGWESQGRSKRMYQEPARFPTCDGPRQSGRARR